MHCRARPPREPRPGAWRPESGPPSRRGHRSGATGARRHGRPGRPAGGVPPGARLAGWWSGFLCRSGGGGCSLGFSMWWGGGQPAVGVAGQPPAALMDRAMVGSAQQREVGEVGGAAMQPMSEMVGFAPGRGPVTAGQTQPPSRTTRAVRWAGVTTRLVRPTSSGWVGAPPRVGGSRVAAAWSQPARPPSPPEPSWWWVRWRVTSTRVTAPSQANRRHASGSSGQGPPVSPPRPPGWGPRRLSRSTVTSSWGRTPPLWGSWPLSRLRRANSARASARR